MLVINKMPRAPSAKNWCFTINNYTDEEYQGVLRCLRSISKYFIIGKEVGDSGTPHLQGYCSLSISHSLSQLKDQLSSRGHFEVAKGGGAHNRVYCSKGNDFVEEGSCPGGTEIRTRPKNRDQLAGNGDWHLNEDDLEFLNSLMPTQESTIGPDIHCSETLLAMPPPSHVQTYMFDGSMVLPEPESQERPMKNCQRLISKSPVPNGGPDIYSRKIVLSTTSDPEE